MEVSLDAILKEVEAGYRIVAQPAPEETSHADVVGVSLLEKRTAADPRTLFVCDALHSKTKPFVPRGATVICIGEPGKTAANAARLVIVDGECDLAGLFNCVKRVIDRYADLERSLLQSVASQSNAQALVDLVTPFLGNEIIVMEADFRTVAHSYPEVKLLASSGLEQLDAEVRNPVELVTFFSNDVSYRDVASLTEPFYYEKSIFSHRVYCANIFSRGEYVSRCVLCEIDKPITPFDEYVFALFAQHMQMAYDLAGGSKAGFAGYLPGAFKELLSGNRVDEARLGMLLAAAEVIALRDYDRANETEYVETLSTYLECSGNALKTASALNIHRGTMAYRLKRIAEIGNVDFGDADRMLHIALTLRVFAQGA